jgi:hypothetical protein
LARQFKICYDGCEKCGGNMGILKATREVIDNDSPKYYIREIECNNCKTINIFECPIDKFEMIEEVDI